MIRKQFYLSLRQEEHLNAEADRTNITASEYLRRIIDADIERIEKQEWYADKNKHK